MSSPKPTFSTGRQSTMVVPGSTTGRNHRIAREMQHFRETVENLLIASTNTLLERLTDDDFKSDDALLEAIKRGDKYKITCETAIRTSDTLRAENSLLKAELASLRKSQTRVQATPSPLSRPAPSPTTAHPGARQVDPAVDGDRLDYSALKAQYLVVQSNCRALETAYQAMKHKFKDAKLSVQQWRAYFERKHATCCPRDVAHMTAGPADDGPIAAASGQPLLPAPLRVITDEADVDKGTSVGPSPSSVPQKRACPFTPQDDPSATSVGDENGGEESDTCISLPTARLLDERFGHTATSTLPSSQATEGEEFVPEHEDGAVSSPSLVANKSRQIGFQPHQSLFDALPLPRLSTTPTTPTLARRTETLDLDPSSQAISDGIDDNKENQLQTDATPVHSKHAGQPAAGSNKRPRVVSAQSPAVSGQPVRRIGMLHSSTPRRLAATTKDNTRSIHSPGQTPGSITSHPATPTLATPRDHSTSSGTVANGRLRSRPVSALTLADFRINPSANDGLGHAFTETVRGKARKCLAGCTDARCCGREMRALAEAADDDVFDRLLGQSPAWARPTAPTTAASMPRSKSTTEHITVLAADKSRIHLSVTEWRLVGWYFGIPTPSVRPAEPADPPSSDSDRQVRTHIADLAHPAAVEEVVMTAKMAMMADSHGKQHRNGFRRRGPTPPGFWDTEFPSTQDEAHQRAAQVDVRDRWERSEVQARANDARRGGGRWIFRDEA